MNKSFKKSKIPFKALELPLKDMIDIRDYIKEYTQAVKNLAILNEKLSINNVYSSYAIKHLMKNESLYSTKIEGTHTTIDKIYEADAESDEDKITVDTEEVLRYNEALNEGMKIMGSTELITNKTIMMLHEILLSRKVRKNSNFLPGNFRTYQNRVGEHIPPLALEVPDLMGNLEKYINEDLDDLEPLVKVAIVHAQFETIHPFPDGNGRVGRVLIPLYLYKLGEISTPVFFLSQELEKSKVKYTAYLQGTRKKTKEGFSIWVKFFLQCVSNQCVKDAKFIDDINTLYETTFIHLKKKINSNKIDDVVKVLFDNPVFTCKMLCNMTGMKETTARKYIQILIDLNIVISSQQMRNKKYYFVDLLDMLNRD